MASHPHLFEDQTDEDFFDKLVDDEFGIGGSSSGAGGIERDLSNLSLREMGAHAEEKEIVEDVVPSEEGGSSVVPSGPQVLGEVDTENSPAEEAASPDSSSGKDGGLVKGTSVKVVQWSAFSAGSEQPDLGGFGSYSDFFPENSGVASNYASGVPQPAWSGVESYTADAGSYFEQQEGSHVFEEFSQQESHVGSADQHNAQQHNPDVTDSQCWDSLYPGWKYDYNTGQWYQVDNQETSSDAQLDSQQTGATASGELGSHQIAHSQAHFVAGEVVSEQKSEVSHLQQTAQTAVATVAESSAASIVTNWNQISQDSMGYPPNMVFDPQYPGWYYDTNTLQWYSLDSYIQTAQTAAAKEQEKLTVGGGAVLDAYSSTQRDGYYNNVNSQFGNQTFQGQSGVEIGSQWDGQMSSYSPAAAWQPAVADQNHTQDKLYENQTIGSFHGSTGSTGKFSEIHAVGSFSPLAASQPAAADQTQQSGNFYENQMSASFHDSTGSVGNFSQKHMSGTFFQPAAWRPGATDHSRSPDKFFESQMPGAYSPDSTDSTGKFSEKYSGINKNEAFQGQNFGQSNGSASFQGFNPAENVSQFTQPKVVHMPQGQETSFSQNYYGNLNQSSYSQQSYQNGNQPFQSGNMSYSQFSTASASGRSSAGRPPHALVTFGFGGKLIIMKENGATLPYGSQDADGKTISILTLSDVVTSIGENSSLGLSSRGYFDSLCKQSFPGPLVGGNATNKELNKWIDERISGCGSSFLDYRKSEHLRLILSLLKISLQHYGKFRSPFGTDPSLLETDGPESSITKLFASVRGNNGRPRDHGSVSHCMHNLPADEQIRTTAAEVQHLLVSGRRKDALQCAQEGLLWGPALVLAAQLGEKFYVDTVKKMAQYQFISGSPLRTLCLLIAGQPADVFSAESSSNDVSGGVYAAKLVVANGMLDSWEENLAIITANRTKDDELVMVHLGDCLWKERDEIIAAHTCYLVAEANFESYSDSARLCLVGADHWKCPRTYASPDAIQRTEFYEYSKVLGNSQFVLLPFQPYKLIYAYMLAEVGKVSDSLRYCQAILKVLKNSSRAPEAETWKQLASSLDERLKTHLQGGYGSNLAPGKLVGKLFTSIDKSISRMMGSPPPSLPPVPHSTKQIHGNDNFYIPPKVSSSQSTMAISSLMPSSSREKINEWTGENRRIIHNRSVSEPDFGRSPKQANSGDPSSADLQNKASNAGGPSRFGRFGSQLFQKTIGWVARSRPDRQAKLGESNKFYYDEKLKRWVEEGAEPPAEEAELPPPPMTSFQNAPTTSFQNAGSDYTVNNALSQRILSNERTDSKPSISSEASSVMPPIPPSTNQFSARGRIGVRSRYVDTFNKGGGALATSFQPPSAPTLKPAATSAKFFVPAPIASSQSTGDVMETTAEASSSEDAASMVIKDSPYSSLSSSSSSHSMPRFPSVDNIAPMASKGMGTGPQYGNGPVTAPARAASWSGSFPDTLNHHKLPDFQPSSDEFSSMSPTPNNPSMVAPPLVNGGNLGDDLHEVEL